MLNQYVQQKNANSFSNPIEAPVKELMDLNMRAMQSFSYLMPTELFSMRRPEDMMEKNLEVLIENSHTALAYMQNMFGLMEKHWLKSFETSLKNTKDFSGLVNLGVRTATSESTHSAKKATKAASTKAKSSASKTKSASTSTKSTATKSVSAKASTAKKPVAKKAMASKSTSPSKTTTTRPASSSASKPSMSSTARPQSSPSAASGAPQHFSSTSSTAKPMMKESDFQKKI